MIAVGGATGWVCLVPRRERARYEAVLRPLGCDVRCAPGGFGDDGGRGGDHAALLRIVRRLPRHVRAVAVVAPTEASLRRAVPGVVVSNRIVAVLPANAPDELEPWVGACRDAARPRARTWALLSEWEDRFESAARRFGRCVRRELDRPVRDWSARRFNAVDLLRRLRSGPSVVCYCGHGRRDGWCGYPGFDRRLVARAGGDRLAGSILAFCCSNLAPARGGVPFGSVAVRCGGAATFLGSVAAVASVDNARLVRVAADVLATLRPSSTTDWLLGIDAWLAAGLDPGAARAWSTYRLVGHPLSAL